MDDDDDLVDQLPDVLEAHRIPATIVRVTPLDGLGVPDHDQARAFVFDEPVWLRLGQVTAHSELTTYGGRRHVIGLVDHVDGGVSARQDHAALDEVLAMARMLRDEDRPGVAVEVWGQVNAGEWWYVLVPWWIGQHPGRMDPEALGGVPYGHELYAGGTVRRAGRWVWPAVMPLKRDPGRPPLVGPFVWYVVATTSVPPPAPGPAALTMAAPTETSQEPLP